MLQVVSSDGPMLVLRLNVAPLLIEDHSTSPVHDLCHTEEGCIYVSNLSPDFEGSALISGCSKQLSPLL